MAALQKIRSKGTLLIAVIGLALFAFIAEEFFRSMETTSNQEKQQIGKIYDEKLNVQEYQSMVDEYTEAFKFMRGISSLNDYELNSLKDQVWQTYVNNKLIEHEAQELGLTVTDGEMEEIIRSGKHQLLQQTPFRNEKTGMFDANMLKNFLTEYDNMKNKPEQIPAEYMEYYQNLYKFWGFVEKSLRESLLNEKYQTLFVKTFISNPIVSKMSYDDRVNKNEAIIVSYPYTAISDNDIQVTDAELKAMYNSKKELFRIPEERRVIKYVDFQVTASEKDKAELSKEMNELAEQLRNENGEEARIVRQSNSVIAYSPVPLTKNAFPTDIQSELDSINTGIVKGPYLNAADNTMNILKLKNKVTLPDSIEFRTIQVVGVTEDDINKRADSIYNALKAGADFEAVAKNYKQSGIKQWLSSRAYEGSTMGEEDAKFITLLNSMNVNAIEKTTMGQGRVIAQVTGRKGMTTKYDLAVIKRPIEFSKETYSKAYNDFSRFVASNPTLKEMEANAAKNGYNVIESSEFPNSVHYVANIPSTRDALRWVFEAKEGETSPLYECGNNDHLLVIALTKIYEEGYRPLEDVKNEVAAMVKRDKKAEKIIASLKNVSNLEQAKAVKDVSVDTLSISFGIPAYIRSVGSTEPAVAGCVAGAQLNKFGGPVKGNNGVFMYQVLSRTQSKDTYNEKTEEMRTNQINMRAASNFSYELWLKANVKDRRYLYF